ncbi:iron ABC transporter permease, partial [Micrococcus sp.]|uniref:FecCD family ABC transporter permease n=1 Tax=Micrococcus sp. TaxID=1271 RepID=UPI0026DCF9E4
PGVVWASVTGNGPADPVVTARIARTVVGVCTGAALGLAGTVMQGLTRNPLADPGVLGINAGASLAMVLAISLGVSALTGYVWFALLGAAVTMLVVYGVAGLGGRRADPVRLVIAGAAVTAGVTSWTTTILLTQQATLDTFRFWQVGTIAGRGLDVVQQVAPLLLVGVLLALVSTRALDIMALGDDAAVTLGRRLGRDRLIAGVAVVLLAGCATALAGPLAFVALLAAHQARMLMGPGHLRQAAAAPGIGAVLILVADTVGRVVLPPAEVQVGVMVAVIGAPVFLVLLGRGWARV